MLHPCGCCAWPPPPCVGVFPESRHMSEHRGVGHEDGPCQRDRFHHALTRRFVVPQQGVENAVRACPLTVRLGTTRNAANPIRAEAPGSLTRSTRLRSKL